MRRHHWGHQQLHHALPAHAIRQEFLQGSRLLASEFPAQQGQPAGIGYGQHRWLVGHRQD